MPLFRTVSHPRTRLVAASLIAALLVCTSVFAQPASPTTDEQQVAAVDDAYVAAELAHDEAALRRLVDDRFVYNLANGTTSGKEAFVQRVLKLPMVGQEVSERTVIVEGDVALVFATTDIRFAEAGQPETLSRIRYTCAYVRRGGQWRMLALQMQQRPK